MEDKHILDQLAAYVDGECRPEERARVEAHLAACGECRSALEDVRVGLAAVALLPVVSAPDSIWSNVEREMGRRQRRQWAGRTLAVAAMLVAAVLAVWQLRRTDDLRGEWVDTHGTGPATLQIGSIGTVEVAPNSRVRRVAATATEQRIALESGRIHAKIVAPPRLFLVDTGAGTAVDLGCEYDLQCDRDGNGYLRVAQGWVAYERQGIESLVPAGASCRTRAGRPPGTPYFDDAPAGFQEALARFDADGGEPDSLLELARARDTLTLWHLLTRATTESARAKIFARMIGFAPLPAGLTRESVLALDRDSLRRWREELAWTW